MTPEAEALVREASAGLRLRDIVLYSSHLQRESALADTDEITAAQQHKRGVKFSRTENACDGSTATEIQILVSLGERVVDDADLTEPTVYFSIEAEYVVLYALTRDLPDAALGAFAEFNAVHNGWPFWRQQVFDLVAQARLPRLQVPLFSGNGP